MEAHAALDLALNALRTRAERPVWQPVPDAVKAQFTTAPSAAGRPAAELLQQLAATVLSYDTGNTHARFYGWVHGSGTAAGLIPALLEAALNANMGGREHAAVYLERQVLAWWAELFGFPPQAGGLTVSGTSLATVLALKAALTAQFGTALRDEGVAGFAGRLCAYTSVEAHSCVARALDLLGLGRRALRLIAVDDQFRLDPQALAAQIAADRAAGDLPFCIIGTVGTVNHGAIDPLPALAAIARREQLWLHIDGAFGALAALSPTLRPLLAGLEQADSLAFDVHKWLHVTYDAGFVLVRDAELLRRAFSDRPDYLAGAERGLAAGNPWFTEYGPELSRGFRALKVWYQIEHFGLERLAASIEENCRLAAYLAARIDVEAQLERLTPLSLNIVCFRHRADDVHADLNALLVTELQERGLAAPSATRIGGRQAIRVNLTNHRTREADLDALVDDVLQLAAELLAGAG
jgi:aromatic-L-amino-acid/L-tryptophan decarboxylase